MCEAEWDNLRDPQLLALVKHNVVVDVHHTACVLVQQEVVQMPVPKAKHVPHLQQSRKVGAGECETAGQEFNWTMLVGDSAQRGLGLRADQNRLCKC